MQSFLQFHDWPKPSFPCCMYGFEVIHYYDGVLFSQLFHSVFEPCFVSLLVNMEALFEIYGAFCEGIVETVWDERCKTLEQIGFASTFIAGNPKRFECIL